MKVLKEALLNLILFSQFILLSTYPAAGENPLTITGDKVRTRLDTLKDGIKIYITELTGHPKILYKDNTLRSEKIIISGREGEIIEAVDNVELSDTAGKSKIKSDKAVFYKLENRAEFTGNPSIRSRKDDDNSLITLKAEKIEYYTEKNTASAFDDVVLVNKDMTIKSGKADYTRTSGEAVFSENPVIYKGEDIYKADEIIYSSANKCIVLNRNARALTQTEDKNPETGKITKTKTAISGDRIEYSGGNEKIKQLTIITGNAAVERDDSVMKGERIEIKGDRGQEVTGNNISILYKEENVEAFGDKFKSTASKKASLYGNPFLIIKDGKTGKEKSRAYGDLMEFFQDKDELNICGNVRIIREAGTITGDMARYERSSSNMYIMGNPAIESEGSILTSRTIVLNTKNNTTKVIGDIKGSGYSK